MSRNGQYFFILIAGTLFGSITVGTQLFINTGLSLYEVSIIPFILGVIVTLPIVLFIKKYRLRKSMLGLFLMFGIFGGIMRLSYTNALILGVPVATVALLIYSQPFWTMLLSKIFLKEPITKRNVIALIFVGTGLIVLINPISLLEINSPFGIFLATLAGVSYSGWIIYSRKGGIKKIPFITSTFSYIAFSLAFIILSYPIISLVTDNADTVKFSLDHSATLWLGLLALISARIIGYALFFKGVEKVPASTSGLLLIVEPLSAMILAVIILQQPLTPNIIFGGIFIILGNLFLTYYRQR